MAVGKKVVVLSEVDDYELCVPEDGTRPKDSFWRKRKKEMQMEMQPVSPLVAVVRMTEPESVAVIQESTVMKLVATEAVEAVEPAVIEPVTELAEEVTAEPISSKFLRRDAPNVGLERGEKICIDCELPYSLEGFYTNSSAKDGRQSRCKECDNKRRAEHNQGLHVKASEKEDFDRETSRKRAVVALPTGRKASYAYKGVSGGFLIYGYVR